MSQPSTVLAFSADGPKSDLKKTEIKRRAPKENDIAIDILYCGVCHSDLHTARSEWEGTIYPCVPGHEIVGRIVTVGSAVTGFKVGDLAGVGCMVDSCRDCTNCKAGDDQLCSGMVLTYNSPDTEDVGGHTLGGYSKHVVVDQKYALRISDKLDLKAVAPLLCAGITTWSPLRHWKVGPGKRVGIYGLGGLGHMGVKFARALGAETVVFTTTASKVDDAKRLGAHEVIISKDAAAMAAQAGRFDFILDCVSADHDVAGLLNLVKADGTVCLVGAPEKPFPIPAFGLIMGRKTLSGSCIGSIKETQEMLDFCAEHGIVSDIETISMDEVNVAYERLLKSDVRYRFVIDMATLA